MAKKAQKIEDSNTIDNVESSVPLPSVDEDGNTESGFDTNGLVTYGLSRTRRAVFIGKKYVPIGDLQDEAMLYMVGMGWGQGIGDAKAGLETRIRGTSKDVKSRWTKEMLFESAQRHGLAMPNGITDSVIDQIVTAEINDALVAKAEAILSGEVATRQSGPRLAGLPKILWEESVAWVKQYCAKRRIAFPTKADELRKMVDFVLANPKVGPMLQTRAKEKFDFLNQEMESFNLDIINQAA